MKTTLYQVLLGLGIIWTTYMAIPNREVMMIVPKGIIIFLLITDSLIVGLLVTALIKDVKKQIGEEE